ncbi:hypothetical protein TELCIR_15773 [Teladorsagia circumcincta]|uniref:EB domain-containing protein n=1 Tax=Teladorsagia circumcincta TaxID=45464 RepID=A0A2G9TXA6_TELCI|nr:hypothetical protein TELCIR_15773 [Teladorsagia circumcincta]
MPPPAGPGCAPACVGGAMCYSGACQCAQPAVVYNPVVGCSPPVPVAPVPMAPAPVIAGRLIPQEYHKCDDVKLYFRQSKIFLGEGET